MGPWKFDLIFELLFQWKIVYTANQVNKLQSLSIQINAIDGILYQAHRCGTSLNGIGNDKNFWIDQNSSCYSWFRLQSTAIHCNRRRGVDRYTSRDFFSHCTCVCTTWWLRVSRRAHFTPSTCHPWCHPWCHMFECSLVVSLFCLLALSCLLSIVYLFSVLHINYHNVESAEDETQCAHA